jgi:hypothetical protein
MLKSMKTSFFSTIFLEILIFSFFKPSSSTGEKPVFTFEGEGGDKIVISESQPLNLSHLMGKDWGKIKFRSSTTSSEEYSLEKVVGILNGIQIKAASALEIDLLTKLKTMHEHSAKSRNISRFVFFLTILFIIILLGIIFLFFHLLKS